jgi:diguanylate cyclase (GGDEF)-like protein
MRLFSRNDLVLLVGLTAALFVVFSRALARLLDVVHDVEKSSGLQLMPGLFILLAVFIFHQLRKRHEIQAEARGQAAAARQANERAAEMERLVTFGEALARALDCESIRVATAMHLPLLAPGRGVWAMTRTGDGWRPLVVVGDSSPHDRERAARRALGEGESMPGADLCFPMIVAGQPVGVLGVSPEPPLTDHQRSVLSTAAALLAVSLKNAELFLEVKENGARDALTGCYNRRHAIEVIDAELRRARRSQMPLSLLMFDLDHFKQINDRYGHLCGDAVLAAVGARMRAVLRGSDLKCRYGGEEFLVLLPETPLAGAQRVAETLRREIEKAVVPWNEQDIRVTASFGVTVIAPGETDPLAVVARADAALYRAKQQGRNCVCLADGDGLTPAPETADAKPSEARLPDAS